MFAELWLVKAQSPARTQPPAGAAPPGKTFRDADVGLDKFTPTPDGGGVVLSTGIHFRILPEHGAPIFTRIGLQIFIVNADGSFEVQEIGGNFDPAENFPGVACDYLADP